MDLSLKGLEKAVCTIKPLSANSPKMVKHIQTIRRQIADELFECV